MDRHGNPRPQTEMLQSTASCRSALHLSSIDRLSEQEPRVRLLLYVSPAPFHSCGNFHRFLKILRSWNETIRNAWNNTTCSHGGNLRGKHDDDNYLIQYLLHIQTLVEYAITATIQSFQTEPASL